MLICIYNMCMHNNMFTIVHMCMRMYVLLALTKMTIFEVLLLWILLRRSLSGWSGQLSVGPHQIGLTSGVWGAVAQPRCGGDSLTRRQHSACSMTASTGKHNTDTMHHFHSICKYEACMYVCIYSTPIHLHTCTYVQYNLVSTLVSTYLR